MSVLEMFLVGRFLTFVLVLTRISGVIATAPLFSSDGIPFRVRGLLAVSLSLLVMPLQHDAASLAVVGNLLELGRLMVLEALVGMLLGLGLAILFAGIQVSGQIVSQMSGMSLADVFSPGFDTNVSVFAQLFYFLTLAVFLGIGGHRMLIEAVLETFQWAPPGYLMLGDTYVETLVNILTQSFVLGIRATAPVLAALLLATLVLGLVSRTLPQLNIIMVGFNLNSLLTLGTLMLSLGAIAWTFQEQTTDVLQQLQECFTSRPAVNRPGGSIPFQR